MDEKSEGRVEQDRYLAIQLDAAKRTKVPDILISVLLLLCLYGFAAAMFVIPDGSFSEQENRMLAQFPALSSGTEGSVLARIQSGVFLDRLFDGRFTGEMSAYFADQFPARDMLVGIKGLAEIALLKKENNGVTLGAEGYLVSREDYPDKEALAANLDAAARFAAAMEDIGVPFTLALAPRSVDVLNAYLPALYPSDRSDALWDLLEKLSGERPALHLIDLRAALRTGAEAGEALYYQTDHHWTTRGAYLAYVEIMEALGLKARSEQAFTISEAAGDFYGTTWSAAGLKWIAPDTIEFYRYEGDDSLYTTTIHDTGESFTGFYRESFLAQKDKYSAFLGGNNARVDVYKSEGFFRKKLLVVKDSFAHAMIPFLAYHYDLIVIDPRYYQDSAARLAAEEQVDGVLMLAGVGSFTKDYVLGILDYGLEGLGDYAAGLDAARQHSEESAKLILYIGDTALSDYVILCPEEAEYIRAAENLRDAIFAETDILLPIVAEGQNYEKALVLSDTGLPAEGLLHIAMQGDRLVFRCTFERGIAEAVERFTAVYLHGARGSLRFPSDFVYSDVANEVILYPEVR